MRKLVALGLLAALLLAIDQAARLVAEGQLASRAREAARSPDSADASITSFPFLGRLMLFGSVPRVDVRVTGVPVGPVRLAAVVVSASGVALSRSAMVQGDVRLEAIDGGTVTVELDGRSITDAVRLPVVISDGVVKVGAGRVAVDAGLTVNDSGSLVLRVAGLASLTVPVARSALVPCVATRVSVAGDRVRLSCEVDELPAVLRR